MAGAQQERTGLCGKVAAENAVEAAFDALYANDYLPIDVLFRSQIVTIQVKQAFGHSIRLVELVCRDGAFIPVVLPDGYALELSAQLPSRWEAYAVYGVEARNCESWGAAYSGSSFAYDVSDLALVFAERPPLVDGFPMLLPIEGEGAFPNLNEVEFGSRQRVEGALHHAIQILLLQEGSAGTMTLYDLPGFEGRSCTVGISR